MPIANMKLKFSVQFNVGFLKKTFYRILCLKIGPFKGVDQLLFKRLISLLIILIIIINHLLDPNAHHNLK